MASLATVLVLAAASVLIVALVERDLQNNARAALEGALETASHTASGEGSARGEGNEQSESSGHIEGSESAESSGSSPAVPDSESSSDARLLQIADASIAETRAGVDAASRALWIIVPAVGAILALAIWAAVGQALRPVRAISGRVAAISGSTLDERVPEPDSGDEIAELAALMNEMLDRLQAASDRQRAFTADASHELRAPLSTLLAAAEVAEVSSDPQKLQELSAKIGGEAQRMQALISDLLDLARLDEQRREELLHTVDLRAVCEHAIERVNGPDVTVTLVETPAQPIVGVESQIERAVFNLVENAVAHADQHVLITLVESATVMAVMVEDDGPGIPPEDRVRVLDRFVRLDESRQRRTGGSGLGLSLSHAIAKRHRGSIDVGDSEHLGGARVTIELPLPGTTPGQPTATTAQPRTGVRQPNWSGAAPTWMSKSV